MKGLGTAILIIVVSLLSFGALSVLSSNMFISNMDMRETLVEYETANQQFAEENLRLRGELNEAQEAGAAKAADFEQAVSTIETQNQQIAELRTDLSAQVADNEKLREELETVRAVMAAQNVSAPEGGAEKTGRAPDLVPMPAQAGLGQGGLPVSIFGLSQTTLFNIGLALMAMVLVIGAYFQWRRFPTDQAPATEGIEAEQRRVIVARPVREQG